MPFQKGQSGNPAGRPRGSRNRSTILFENLLEGDTEAIARKLGGPLAWKDRPGFSFFQGPAETVLIRTGAQTVLKTAPAAATR